MSVPGPPGGLWALSLLLWAAEAAVVGEAVRGTVARWIPLWRPSEPVERGLLDLYLGGAAMYLLAAVQLGAFVLPLVLGLPLLAGAVVAYRALGVRRAAASASVARPFLEGLADRWTLVALASALGLFAVELACALPVATGNTYDSSLLTTYVAGLLQRGSLPLTFQPYGPGGILYPQGATVWLGWAQLDFGLPAARTALLVTPLFLGLTPLSGFVLGRRLVGTSRAGAAFAVALAWLGPSTRAVVGGSNDFVLALPLVLLLGAQSTIWFSRALPAPSDTVGFGVLLGYSAAMNVTGAQWLLLALVLAGATTRPAFAGRTVAWIGRWATTVASTLVAGIPSLYVLLEGRLAPSTLAGSFSARPGEAVGITLAQWIGSVDPFLFRGNDLELSPIPAVRLELALLLVLGAAALLWFATERPRGNRWSELSRWATTSAVALAAWLGVEYAAGLAGSPVRFVAFVSSPAELSLCLFTVYGLVAAVPLAVALEHLEPWAGPRERPSRASSLSPEVPLRRAVLPIAFAIVVVAPAVVLTPTSLAGVLSRTYEEFGNVSAADFALFAYAGSHVSPGERVLVAPGSAAEFLPGYVRGIVLIFPMAPGATWRNASYALVVRELTNGTLDLAGRQALARLDVDLVVVTGNNTVLWPSFWVAPLREAEVGSTPTFPVLWNEGDAWVFNASACRVGAPACS